MDLQILAKHYFYSCEIKSVRGSKRPVKKGRRCLAHCSNHSYKTTADGYVLFSIKEIKHEKKWTFVQQLSSWQNRFLSQKNNLIYFTNYGPIPSV